MWEGPHFHTRSWWCPHGQDNDKPVLERLRDLSGEVAAATVQPAPPSWEVLGSWRLGMVKNHPRTLIVGLSNIRALGLHTQHLFCSHPLLCRSWPRGTLPASSGKRSLQSLVRPTRAVQGLLPVPTPHRTMEWFGLEGASRSIPFHPLALHRDTLHPPKVL